MMFPENVKQASQSQDPMNNYKKGSKVKGIEVEVINYS